MQEPGGRTAVAAGERLGEDSVARDRCGALDPGALLCRGVGDARAHLDSDRKVDAVIATGAMEELAKSV